MTDYLRDLFGLTGKVAVVTGGANGIGLGIATVLAEAGATVVLADRDGEGARREAASLTALGLNAVEVIVDLADEQSIVDSCADIVANVGAPWLLVNNAALQDREPLLEATATGWDRIHAVNAVLPGAVITPGAINAKGVLSEGPATRQTPFGFQEPRESPPGHESGACGRLRVSRLGETGARAGGLRSARHSVSIAKQRRLASPRRRSTGETATGAMSCHRRCRAWPRRPRWIRGLNRPNGCGGSSDTQSKPSKVVSVSAPTLPNMPGAEVSRPAGNRGCSICSGRRCSPRGADDEQLRERFVGGWR
ncbi:SDR family NAD(P)-dependent oxidoreductase [Mycobacterium antarcticum]|uniref:SDR family NAD(P)-dependent oxidoreductase n=1 Tax=Mycolicibacterium sp. TUM20984 TaxID=3023368 RepID=UPI0024E0D58A|nr:SDR family NAD(P)-dependent oxidoreductase [Mycolicibacterium sp. TUM20984]